MKKSITLFYILFAFTPCFSQQITQTIRGTVIDQDAGSPLTGATIFVEDTDPVIGVVSDMEGKFRLENVPVGRHNISASFIGYEKVTLSNIYISAGKELVLTIELEESFEDIEEVVITYDVDKSRPINDMATLSARTFSVEETQRYAASISDPARMALNFAGVSCRDDLENEIVIRGNSPKGLLWRLEGVEIPNPNHFGDDGASGGAISIISSNALTNSDFFTGAFPAEYGNALSGVFDLKLRNGNNEKREYTFQAGFLGVQGAIEGPFVKENPASYLVNYRYSTLALLNAMGINIAGDATPTFSDLTFKFNLPGGKLGAFSLFGIGGSNQVESSGNYWKSDETEKIGILGLTHTIFISDNTSVKSVALTSGTNTLDKNYGFDWTTDTYFQNRDEDFSKHWIKYAASINHKLNARHTIRSGFIYTYNGYHGIVDQTIDTSNILVNVADVEGSTSYIQTYASWKYRIFKDLTMNSGLHYLYYDLSKNYSIEPRLGFKWDFAPRQSLSIAGGIHGKFESLANHLTLVYPYGDIAITPVQPNAGMGFTKANHVVVGYDYFITDNLHLKLEAYYQYLYDVPVERDNLSFYSLINQTGGSVNFPLSNEGTGRNYGIEFTFESFFADDYYYMFTASVFESKYKGSDGIERNTRFNSNYVFNLLGGKEFKVHDKNLFGINAKTTWAGGNRIIPIDFERSLLEGYETYLIEQAFEEKVSDYFRIDLQVNYKWNLPKSSHEIRLDIQNVTNRLNVKGLQYSGGAGIIEEINHLGLVPVLSYRLQF